MQTIYNIIALLINVLILILGYSIIEGIKGYKQLDQNGKDVFWSEVALLITAFIAVFFLLKD